MRTMTMAESNEELVERVSFETYTEGNVDVIDELVSEEYRLYDPMSPEPIRGREGLKDYVESLREAAPDFSATIEHVIADDEFVAVHFTIRGTQEGSVPDLGLEPTGNPFEVVGIELDRIEEGKLVETWLAYDTLGFAEQLGALETKTAAVER
jgi:predicted ester cyclase